MALYYRYRAVVYMACGSAVVWKIWAYRGELVRYYRLPRGTTAVDFYRGGPTLISLASIVLYITSNLRY